MDGKDTKKRKGGGCLAAFLTILLLIAAVGVFAYSAWKLYGFYLDYEEGTDEYEELGARYSLPELEEETDEDGLRVLSDISGLNDPDTLEEKLKGVSVTELVENKLKKKLPKMKNPIDFEGLGEINPEVIAWLKVEGIDASYPVAQGPDNDFYLHRTFEKMDNFAGCIFLDAETSSDFTDQNSVIYGHNMKNGSMFGKLKQYKDQALYDEYPYFWIFAKNFIYQYRIFSAMETNSSNDLYKIRHYTEEDFEELLSNMHTHSLIDTGVTAGSKDRIVTLSTCTANSSVRFIVAGKLEQIYASA